MYKNNPCAIKEAEKLGFEIGQLVVWDNTIGFRIIDTIKSIHYLCGLSFGLNDYADSCSIDYASNKLAIHCPTPEDFEFMCKRLNINYFKDNHRFCSNNYILINENKWKFKEELNDYTIISIDEYFKALGKNPLFVTEDGKNIYDGMNCCFLHEDYISVIANWSGHCPGNKYFSNKQNAENYYNSLKQKDMQKVEIEIPKNYQVTDTFESKVTDNLTLKGVVLEKKQPILKTKDRVNLYLGDTFYFIDETNSINESKIVDPNFEILPEYLHFSTKEAAQNYLKSLLKANTGKFEIGDKVKVIKKAESKAGDWDNSWEKEMDISVNKIFTIISVGETKGYELEDNLYDYYYPEFVLELVEKPLVKVGDKFIYASDLKENKVYYSENNNGKKVIWRFKSVSTGSKINNGFINAKVVDVINQNFNKIGVNDQWWNNFREATFEEIQHLKRCEYFDRYVEPLVLEENKWYELNWENGCSYYALYQSNKEKYCGFAQNSDWSENVAHKDNLLRICIPANMDKVEKLLLNKANKDYPIGIKFKSVANNEVYTSGGIHKIWTSEVHPDGIGNDPGQGILYSKGNWAKVIKEEFKVGDWVKVVNVNGVFHTEVQAIGHIFQIKDDHKSCEKFNNDSTISIDPDNKYYVNYTKENIRKATKEEVKKHLQEKANKEIEETLKNFNE